MNLNLKTNYVKKDKEISLKFIFVFFLFLKSNYEVEEAIEWSM